ncbi:hypothetical protein HPB52_003190 [Rhipicephalus sanguineus]|uniref:Uncharacterized protein n=1 Tax=Rhipicephalus sanguineus TaxID=34632 RepID=A0A9D4PC68_RHISA|nr:hypothetical protein HPB52_003190 [Rhipicephalus sanguineus]
MEHIFWDCPADPPPEGIKTLVGSQNYWETLLTSPAPDVQVRVTARTQEVAFSTDGGPSGGVAEPITPSTYIKVLYCYSPCARDMRSRANVSTLLGYP